MNRSTKILFVISLSFFASMAVFHAHSPVSTGPYFFRRLAHWKYALIAEPGMIQPNGPWDTFAYASSHQGQDITSTAAPVAGGATFLAALSLILDLRLNFVPFLPIIPIAGACNIYLLTKFVSNRHVAMSSACLSLVYLSQFAHFHEYRFGRFVFLPLTLYFYLNSLKSDHKEGLVKYGMVAFVSQMALKFTAPGSEVIAVNAVVIMGILAIFYRSSHSRSNMYPFWPIMLFSVTAFFLLNPKLYSQVAGGILRGTSAVTFGTEQGLSGQMQQVVHHLTQILIPGSPTNSEFGYANPDPQVSVLLRKLYSYSLTFLLGLYGSITILNSLREKELGIEAISISSVGVGILLNFLYRGVLLGRAAIKGLQLSLLVFGVVGASKILSKRTFHILVMSYLIIMSVSLGYGAVDMPGKPYQFDTAEDTANWQVDYVPTPAPQFIDYHLYGNLAYYYAESKTSGFWNKYPITQWDYSTLKAMVAGSRSRLSADYIVVDKEMSKYGSKPRSFEKYPPLSSHIPSIDREYSSVYSNGDQKIYVV